MLDGKRVLIIDEVSRTGSTLRIAERLFRLAFPDAAEITGSYFWHPSEQPITLGQESVLTSLPVWYDPGTLTGRGIGGLDPAYHRKRYEYYADLSGENPDIDVKKLRTYAFSGDVYSAPLLKDDGSILDLAEEKITRMLCRDLKKLYHEYHRGMLFFMPPMEWEQERFENAVRKQGIRLLSDAGSRQEAEKLRRDPLFYLNFISRLMTM